MAKISKGPQPLIRTSIATLLLFIAPVLFADSRDRGWQDALATIDGELRAAKFESANHRLDKLSHDIGEKMATGAQARYTVAVIASFRAIAAAGSGDLKNAEWYWSAARSLFPQFAGSNLSVYGDAGRAVMKIDSSRQCEGWEVPAGSNFKPPKATHTEFPRYPQHALETGVVGLIKVELLVDPEGKPRCPRVLEGGDEVPLAWLVLQGLHEWTFEPGMLDGKAIPTKYVTEVNCKIDYRSYYK